MLMKGTIGEGGGIKNMRVVLTKDEAINKGIWLDIIKIKGFDEFNVRQMPGDQEIELTKEEAQKLGLLL